MCQKCQHSELMSKDVIREKISNLYQRYKNDIDEAELKSEIDPIKHILQ